MPGQLRAVPAKPLLPGAALLPADATAGADGDSAEALHFDGFSILPRQRRLLVAGAPAKLGARAFDLLMALASNRGRVVPKDELFERVWADTVVEDNNLTVHVSQLRKLCGQAAIATVPGRGYQFTATTSTPTTTIGTGTGTALAPPAADADATPPGPAAHGNLAAVLPSLIGRDPEQAELAQLLASVRWVTLTGAAGMGKTRLAEGVGHALNTSRSVWLVELASVNDPRFVPSAVAQALGATLVDAEHVHDALVAALQGLPTLLILDNCEHLTDAVGALCASLLDRLPQLRILVTSQVLLRREGETVFKLGPLSLPAGTRLADIQASGAVRLLCARVQAQWRQFQLTPDTLADAAALCRQVDGLPLAIELLAGRVPMLGLAGVRARMGEMLRLLTGDARVRLRRHQTLRAALDWSYQLLDTTEQRLLRRLGSFAGSFSIDGVRLLGAPAGDPDAAADQDWLVLDTLASLIDKSLVQLRGDAAPRYALLETTRSYAMEQLAATGETEDALASHARTIQAVCALATRQRDTAAIWHEVANVRAAFDWAMRHGQHRLAIALACDSAVVIALGGLVGEVLDRLVAVEPFVDASLPLPLAAQYWQWLGRFGSDGRLPARRCVQALERAEAGFRALGNHRHVHACLRMRTEALLDLGDIDAAGQAIAAARALEPQGHPLADRMRRMRLEGMVLDARGQPAAAVQVYEQALALAQMAAIHRYVVMLTQDIGQALLNGGDAAAAAQRFSQVLDDRQPDLSTALAEAYARMGLATALLMQGQLAPAGRAAQQALPQLRSCGILLAHAECLAWLLAQLGQRAAADAVLRSADAFRRFSQTARTATDSRAHAAARALLGGPALPAEDADTSWVGGAEDELVQMIGRALADGLDAALDDRVTG